MKHPTNHLTNALTNPLTNRLARSLTTPSTDRRDPVGHLRIALVEPRETRPPEDAAGTLGYAPPLLRSPVPREPGPLLQTRCEGWVQVDLTVDSCGRVQGADVVASSGEPRFDRAARLMARTWSFRPALVCGRLAVPSCCRLLLQVRIEEAESFGATFRETLEATLELLDAGDDARFVAAVEGELAALAARPAERAHLALLRADVHRMRGEPAQELEALYAGLDRDGDLLAEAVRTLALQRCLRLELEAGLADAVRRTVSELRGCAGPLVALPVEVIDALDRFLEAGEDARPDEQARGRASAWRLPWFDQVLLADAGWITSGDEHDDVPVRVTWVS